MKAAIYCRLSEADEGKAADTDDSGSIQNQKALLTQYAKAHGWEIEGVYSDDDYAGADRSRPAFRLLLRRAEQRRFDVILCTTQSRFTREMELVEKYIHGLLPQWGVRFISVIDNADTAQRGNKKARQINGLVNEWYLEDLSENVRGVLDARRKNGLHIGAFALYGYRKDPRRKGGLLVDEEAAAVVRQVFTLFAGGMGKTAIARLLNERGVPNPSAYKRLHGLRYRQGAGSQGEWWKYATIAAMLKNEMYLGNMVQGRYGSASYKTKRNLPRPKAQWYVVEGTHEAIIDRPLWERVQAMLAQKSRPFAGGKMGLFAKKARCALCGYTLRSTVSKGRRYLQCPNRRVSSSACAGAFISEERLAGMVCAQLQALSASCLSREALEKALTEQEKARAPMQRLRDEESACRKKAEECSCAIDQLYSDKARGVVTERDYMRLARQMGQARERWERAAREAESRLRSATDRQIGEQTRQAAETAMHPQRLTHEMVDALVEHIAVGKRLPGTREVPIAIHWRF